MMLSEGALALLLPFPGVATRAAAFVVTIYTVEAEAMHVLLMAEDNRGFHGLAGPPLVEIRIRFRNRGVHPP